MATMLSDLDLYISLCDKLGDAETRQLILYIQAIREEAKSDITILRAEIARLNEQVKRASEAYSGR